MPITALPIAPNRQDPATFSSRADAWVGALDTFTTEANALQTDVNAKQVTASNAATTATNAVQSINSALNRYTFSTTTTMADPGVGIVRFNNATASSATAVAIDAQSADTGNPNILNLLLSFGDSTNNPKGLIRFTQAGTPANYRAYNVTAVTNNTGWVQFTVTHVASAGSFSNGASLVMEFHRAGNTGDVQLSANNTFTGNNSFNNTTVISANSASDALRITQTGAGNALVVEDSTSPDSTPFVIDANGRAIVGTTAAQTFGFGSQSPDLQVHGTVGSRIGAMRWTNDTTPAIIHLAKSRGASVGVQAAVQTSDQLGLIAFDGSNGTNVVSGAYIQGLCSGTPGASGVPSSLIFSTSSSGSEAPSERMRINADGRVGIGDTGTNGTSVSVGGVTPASSGFSTGSAYQGSFDPVATTVSAAPFLSSPSVSAGGTIPNLRHFIAQQGTFTGSVSDQKAFEASSGLIGATNNYGFYGNIPSGTGRWNFYAAGTAANYFAGETTIASGFTIGRTAVTSPAASDGNVFSGTYTPTLTNTSNISSSSAYASQYMRVGNTVTVSGSVDITPVAANTTTVLRISIPIATGFLTSLEARGVSCISDGGGSEIQAGSGSVSSVGSTSVVELRCAPNTTSSRRHSFQFTYRVI